MLAPTEECHHYRTIWLSDIHLGTPGCQAYYLLDFLRTHKADTLYLVGDILDGWQLKKGWYWPQAHNDVVQKVLRAARKGTKVVYIPGNHDEHLRQFIGLQLGGISIAEDAIHVTADGRRLWVVHGDLFDSVIRHARWLAHLGDRIYVLLLKLNRWLNAHSPAARHAVLVAVAVPEAPGQERRQLHLRLRAVDGGRGAPARLRRRGLRAHPQGRGPRDRRASSTAMTATGSRA